MVQLHRPIRAPSKPGPEGGGLNRLDGGLPLEKRLPAGAVSLKVGQRSSLKAN